ncbi:MAG: lptC [Nevskia sp.]|nr:lptC [Nevskia sp.]
MKQKLVIPLLLFAAAIGLFLTLQHLDQGTLVKSTSADATPRYTLVDAEWTRYDANGDPALLGQASQIVYMDDQSGTATELVVDVLGIGGAPWRLSAPTAVLPAAQRKFELTGTVDIAGRWPDNGEAVRARTDQLWIDPDTHQFYTESPVEWDSVSRSGTSRGMHADWRYKALQLLHDANMTYRMKATPTP